jgi:hypothetical protein
VHADRGGDVRQRHLAHAALQAEGPGGVEYRLLTLLFRCRAARA